MRKPFLLILPLLACFNCYGQELPAASVTNSKKATEEKRATKQCTTEITQMPLINGISLGMSYDKVREVYPEIETNEWFQKNYRVDKSGLFMVSAADVSNNDYPDLQQISLNFENGEVRDYDFIYKPEKWDSVENMLKNLSEVFSVASENWIVFDTALQMNCTDFTVYANHLPSGDSFYNSFNAHKKVKSDVNKK